ncbi:hypothetical protein [Pseudomonas panipatensis]|uniref:Uncharacterized protein n=1 Tax=Pseudomonas panipatensis TaxID=428992 RepID=A0A1G8CVG2_9PSED|nr:hypothetical protein [Pseudomonas panipatensis]SDH49284.1 hypothetical protein SAMN05216272_101782 [Pseudomonas panipatensis]SMP63402.1 hypothetical protein SAMN06295951_10660 [Pseudomonas panipatensis]
MKGSISAADLDDAVATLAGLGGDLPNRVLADAMNHTANQANQALLSEIDAVFDQPTPFTQNAIRILNATPSRLEASLWVKDEKSNNSKGQAPEDWVAPQVFGGPRVDKASERNLRAKGILPAGLFIVPAEGARLDQYGNMSRGQMIQILSGLGALESRAGFKGNATQSARSLAKGHQQAYFVMRRGKVPIGIGERRDKTLVMVLAFVRQPQYRERFKFFDVVRRIAEDDARLEANIEQALAKARLGDTPSSFRRGGR